MSNSSFHKVGLWSLSSSMLLEMRLQEGTLLAFWAKIPRSLLERLMAEVLSDKNKHHLQKVHSIIIGL
ncbi:hypothetical protein Moror_8317 [Moniliophthora roreri MCA 2997]|uniref:Uncharacterized protein n=1 Tax=Moniliophthora roreri (strain MCA 2997) TaxID=1381753 RepID=V2X500_MONRO|nr:hypothetical protein Moror_8317 [Moniliophthora roreri MCA 2997]